MSYYRSGKLMGKKNEARSNLLINLLSIVYTMHRSCLLVSYNIIAQGASKQGGLPFTS